MEQKSTLKEIAALFLKLGFIGFGGPAAHIAIMQQEVVKKKKWLTEEHFLDLVGATNLIPGPNSTELAIHIGYEKAAIKELIVAGVCFISPAVILTGFLAWLYQSYGHLPDVQPFLSGIKPALIAIVIAAIVPLAKKSLKSKQLFLIGLTVLIAAVLKIPEFYLLFGAGFLALILHKSKTKNNQQLNIFLPLPLIQVNKSLDFTQSTNLKLFLIFLKIGALLYGSGYVLFAFLDAELVSKGLLSKQQLIDAIAVGQLTPGPVFSAVTFVGFQINGLGGAAVATLAVFLPSFVFVALLRYIVPQMRQNTSFSAFLDTVNVASVALILNICFEMGKTSIVDVSSASILLLSGFICWRFPKINSAILVLMEALLGYCLRL